MWSSPNCGQPLLRIHCGPITADVENRRRDAGSAVQPRVSLCLTYRLCTMLLCSTDRYTRDRRGFIRSIRTSFSPCERHFFLRKKMTLGFFGYNFAMSNSENQTIQDAMNFSIAENAPIKQYNIQLFNMRNLAPRWGFPENVALRENPRRSLLMMLQRAAATAPSTTSVRPPTPIKARKQLRHATVVLQIGSRFKPNESFRSCATVLFLFPTRLQTVCAICALRVPFHYIHIGCLQSSSAFEQRNQSNRYVFLYWLSR